MKKVVKLDVNLMSMASKSMGTKCLVANALKVSSFNYHLHLLITTINFKLYT